MVGMACFCFRLSAYVVFLSVPLRLLSVAKAVTVNIDVTIMTYDWRGIRGSTPEVKRTAGGNDGRG
jgi:hypothetical protein